MVATGERRCAIVTGASYGVGAATALALAEAGYDLVLTATKLDNLAATRASLSGIRTRVLPLALDVCQADSIDAAVATTIAEFGHIDVLINNAGTNLRKYAVDVTPQEWDYVMDTSIKGAFFLTQQVGRHMIAAGTPGAVVNVTSSHAFIGAKERSTYGIAKAALVQMTRMLAVEWAEHRIRVNAVAPGRMETASPSRADTGNDPKYMAAMLSRIPLGKFATAEEVAAACVFLAGTDAASITGQILVIDGGLTVM